MRISIIVIHNGDNQGFYKTLESIMSQSYPMLECVAIGNTADIRISDINEVPHVSFIQVNMIDSKFSLFNIAIQQVSAEYVLFLESGDLLSNDRVIEELVMNHIHEDLIVGNTLIRVESGRAETYILIPDSIRLSDLAIKELPVQSILFKRSSLQDMGGFDTQYMSESARHFCVNGFVNHGLTVRHVNLFVSQLKEYHLDLHELKDGLHKYIPTLAQDMEELLEQRALCMEESYRVLKKFGESAIFSYFLKLRSKAEKFGFYTWKAKLKQKRYYKKIALRDAQIRKEVEAKIMALPDNMLNRNNDASDIIVSLTTYGHRVTDAAPHAIYTLFTQNRLPNRVLLFLDYDNWNEQNIPPLLKKLQRSGLEIYFCEDIKPYKKLIPALQMFPDNPIITVDDDVYYNPNTISELVDAYEQSDRRSVICHWAFVAEKRNGKFTPYTQWRDNKYGNEQSFYTAVGQDGVLYPPRIFDDEVFNKDVFMEKCKGDDIWFFIQEYRNKIPVRVISNSSKGKNSYVNSVDQWVPTQKSALYYLNDVLGMNNKNLNNLVEHYCID